VKALDRKLLRDLRLMWSQAITIALVVGSAVAGFITSFSAYDALEWSRDIYYAEARFADVFSRVKRAPRSLESKLQSLPGVATLQTTLEHDVQIDIAGVPDPMIGRLIGLHPKGNGVIEQRLNHVTVRSGRMIEPHRGGHLEALVSEGFAIGRNVKLGDQIHALINGKRELLVIVGVATSPEYVFAGLGGSPDLRGFGIFWIDHEALASAYNERSAFNRVAVRLAPQSSEGQLIDALNRALENYGGIDAHGRDRQMSNLMLNSEIRQQRILGTVLPSIFLAVAGFLLNVVLSRQISTQREQIAALKALGYGNLVIGMHYLKLVMIITVCGLLLGIAVGAWAGHWFSGIYANYFRFPELHYRVKPSLVVAAALVSIVAAALGTLNAIAATVRLAPAEAMHPPAPGKYRRSFVERMGLTRWLSTAMRMILRTMQRRFLRTVFTTFGIAISMAIVVVGAFWNDSIDYLFETQFGSALRGDVVASLVEETSAEVLRDFERLPGVTAVEGTRDIGVRFVNRNHEHRGSIQGFDAAHELRQIVDLSQRIFEPPVDGVIITDRLARKLDIRVGDALRVELLEGERDVLSVPVVGEVKEMMGMNAYMERRALNRLLNEGDVVSQVTLAVDRNREAELLLAMKALPRVVGTTSKSVMTRNMREVTARNMLIFSAILTAFACVIAVGVVYNNARIALAERAWELASLRVLGFTRAEVSGFLLGELAIEIMFAIPLGIFLGYGLALTIVNMIQSDEFYFPLVIEPRTYFYAALSVVVAGIASALVVRRRIDNLDLVAVLKTRE
jgi:putative ABC transport system permease protein